MAVRDDFTAGEVLAAADLNDTFASKLDEAGGKILQIVRATDSTERSTTSTSYVDVTGVSVTITPQKSDSAILIIATGGIQTLYTTGANQEHNARLRITDSSNNPISGATDMFLGADRLGADAGNSSIHDYFTMLAWSTPATTSAVTYKLQFRTVANTAAYINTGGGRGPTQMFAIEVSA